MGVTDNGANMVKAITLVLGAGKHLPCFAHTIDLIPKKACGDKILTPLIDSVKSIVRYFKQSNRAADELRRLQEESVYQNTLKLVQSGDTRWNSTFYMLSRFIELSDIVGVALLKFPEAPTMLTATELHNVKEVLLVLRPFEITLREMEGDHFVTCSKVIPAIYSVKKIILSLEPTSSVGINLKNSVLADLEKRFGQVENVSWLAVATLLDPRFKTMYFENSLAMAETMRKIRRMIQSLEAQVSIEVKKNQSEPEANVTESQQMQEKQDSIWKFHDDLLKKQIQSKNESTNSELNHYLEQRPIHLVNNFDPIQFWINYKGMYPLLSKIAMQHFVVVATSAPSERLFSMSGNIMDPARNRLSPDRLKRLLFLNSLSLGDWKITL